jgi:hypothetical protein
MAIQGREKSEIRKGRNDCDFLSLFIFEVFVDLYLCIFIFIIIFLFLLFVLNLFCFGEKK